MSEKDDGGPAFPAEEVTNYPSSSSTEFHLGMTLRDYFEAKAMQALLMGGAEVKIRVPEGVLVKSGRNAIPELAYEYADEMIKARKS